MAIDEKRTERKVPTWRHWKAMIPAQFPSLSQLHWRELAGKLVIRHNV